MSYRHTLQAAIESLNEIEDLVKGFPENGHIPAVEIDLALQKLRNLYELLLLFRDIDKSALPEIQNTVREQQTVVSHTVEQTTKVIKPETEVWAKPPEAEPDTTEVKHVEPGTAKPAEKPSDIIIAQVIEKKEVEVKKTRLAKNVQTLADQFKERATLLESLRKPQSEESEYTSLVKPVGDLMSAIAINDRFSFIRELFNNDKSAFENAINNLNNLSNFNEAYNYMTEQFDWDMDSHTVQSLLDIVRRKYIKRRDE